MLKIINFSIRDDVYGRILVDNLSFTLNDNEKIAIIGSEGSGKTTLLNAIFHNKKLENFTITGEIMCDRRIGFIKQKTSPELYNLLVREYLIYDEFIGDYDYSLYEKYDDIIIMLKKFGLNLEDLEEKPISVLSGGEKIKLRIVKELIKNPDILLFDEPTNDLDYNGISWVENFIKSCEKPILYVSHDKLLLENTATGIIELSHVRKKTVAKTRFLNVDCKTYETTMIKKFERDDMIARKQRSDMKVKEDKHNKIYNKVKDQQDDAVRDPFLARKLKVHMKALKSREKRLEIEKEKFTEIPEKEEGINIFFDEQTVNKNKDLLNIANYEIKIGNKVLVNNVSLSIKGDSKIVIVGKNGTGKTLLVKEIIKVLKENDIRYGYVPQNYAEVLNYEMDSVAFLVNEQNKYKVDKIRQILGNFGFKNEEMLYRISQLSEGQKLKILLLLLISKEVEIIILDEPTRNISPLNQDELVNLFSSFKGAILAVSHDRYFIDNVFESIFELTKEGITKLK